MPWPADAPVSVAGMSDVLSVQRLIPSPPEPIFDLLVDPAGHSEIDGGGTVKGARSGGRRLVLGDRFGMDMKLGVAYSTRNTVIELEENRRIAWRTLAASPLDKLFTGRTWRYELEPVDGGTLVRETWDSTTEAWPGRLAMGRLAGLTRRNMEATLRRIEEVVTAAA